MSTLTNDQLQAKHTELAEFIFGGLEEIRAEKESRASIFSMSSEERDFKAEAKWVFWEVAKKVAIIALMVIPSVSVLGPTAFFGLTGGFFLIGQLTHHFSKDKSRRWDNCSYIKQMEQQVYPEKFSNTSLSLKNRKFKRDHYTFFRPGTLLKEGTAFLGIGLGNVIFKIVVRAGGFFSTAGATFFGAGFLSGEIMSLYVTAEDLAGRFAKSTASN